MNHIAQIQMTNLVRIDLGAGDCFLDHARGQIGRGEILQAATKRSDGGTNSTDDNDFTAHIHYSSAVARSIKRMVKNKCRKLNSARSIFRIRGLLLALRLLALFSCADSRSLSFAEESSRLR